MQAQAAIKTLDRLIQAALLPQRSGEVEEVVGDARVLPDRFHKPLDRNRRLPGKQAEQAHQMQSIGMVRIERECLPAVLLGGLQLPCLQQTKPGLEERGRRVIVRRGGQGWLDVGRAWHPVRQ